MTATRAATSNDKALNDFLAAKRDIDTMLARIRSLSDDHFEIDPDAIHWGNVGALKRYAGLLREITDSVFSEGEHAK